MPNPSEKFLKKEVVLTIRVPADFDREDERALDDAFAATLEQQGWKLVNSKEYRDIPGQDLIPVNRVTITRERYSEDESWADHFWVDASKTPSVELFRDAVQSYLKTEEGKTAIDATCNDFNWGDAMVYVPEAVWNEHGIYPFDFHRTPQEMGLTPTTSDNLFTFTVNQDEVLIPEIDLGQEEEVTIIPATTLPKGWAWHHYMDGSGSLDSPDGESFFSYDRAPYATQNGIEYKETADGEWSVFWGSFGEFTAHAEKHISQTILQTPLMLGEHDIPDIMQELANNAWYGREPHTVHISAGDHIIKIQGYTYEPSYESFSATASISMGNQMLYGLDSENIGPYQNKVIHTGIYTTLEEAVSHIKEHTKGLDYVLETEPEPNRPKFNRLLSDAQTRSSAGQPAPNITPKAPEH